MCKVCHSPIIHKRMFTLTGRIKEGFMEEVVFEILWENKKDFVRSK